VRIVTVNVRNPSFDDGVNSWSNRRDAFFETVRRLDPDLLCLQETIVSHVEELLDRLPGRVEFGLPREEGENAEMCAVLVREETPVTCSETEWLSPTPKVVGSKGWGAVCPRVVTWLDFGDWAILNAHLDHISLDARTNGMRPIVARAEALGKPCLLTGDFNAEPDEPALQLARDAGFVDLAEGTGPTYHGFGQGPLSRIDYILARGPWRCERAWVEKGDYSDHWAVVADVGLNASQLP
jgi:endonuclease/exonuclease/phosphatase family metal-dependent hydrolase